MRKLSNLQITLNPVCRPKKTSSIFPFLKKKLYLCKRQALQKKRTRAETFNDKGSHPSGYSHKKNIRHGESRQDSEEQSMKKKMMMGFTANIQSVHGNRKRIMETFNDAKKQKMSRIKEEQRVVEQMIRLYCRKKEGNKELCPGCQELLQYAAARLERCKFGENKPTCKKCPIHCYRPQMKERMCKVMRWAGPRMILHHPVAAIRHVMREL